MKKIQDFIEPFLKKEIPDIRPGDTVKVYQKIPARVTKKSAAGKKDKEKGKEKIQVFEGIVIARKHGKEIGATITVRKVVDGIGVERIFPLHLPTIDKIEILKRSKVRRAKLYYLRKAKGKRARLKRKELVKVAARKEPKEKIKEASEKKTEKEKEPQEAPEEMQKEENK